MNETIQAFLKDQKIAIVGASPKADNFGRTLMVELTKKGYETIPVNPSYPEVEDRPCVNSVRELPEDIHSAILAVHPSMTDEIIEQCIGSGIRRVWMIKGVGKGAYTESAHEKCRQAGIEVVYGFCPMMFFGTGMHKFHFWIRKNLGKVPREYKVSMN
jgi:predicted CoA-binding protein